MYREERVELHFVCKLKSDSSFTFRPTGRKGEKKKGTQLFKLQVETIDYIQACTNWQCIQLLPQVAVASNLQG